MKKAVLKASKLFITAIISTMLITGVASADVDSFEDASIMAGAGEDIEEAPGYEDPKDSDRAWAISIGLTSGIKTDYEGSNDYEVGIGPSISASWRDTIFYKGKTLGANLIRQKKLKAGILLTRASGRDEDDNDKLEGLDDVDSSLEAGGFVSYRMKPMRFRVEARQDVDSGHEGALVDLSAGTTLPFNVPRVFASIGTTWASDDYMDSFFTIDAKQSANSGLRKYSAESGFKDVKLALTTGYSITNRWRVGGLVEYKRLVGDAADSPIVDDKNQFLAGFSLSYHMGSKVLPEELK